MSPSLTRIFRFMITVFLTGFLIFFLIRYKDQISAVREISLGQFCLIFTLVLFSVTLNGSKLNQLIRFFGLKLTAREWFGLSSITSTFNNMFFKAGSLVTSNYLKRKHNFPYMSFLGSLGADQLILLLLSGMAGYGISFYLMAGGKLDSTGIPTAYFLITLILFIAAKFAPGIPMVNHKIMEALTRAANSLRRILKNRKLFLILGAHNLALIALTSLRFYMVCQVLQLRVALVLCILFATLMTLVSAIPLLQSDIGSREIAVGLLSELAGTGFNEGLLATLIDRIFVFLITFLFTLFFKNLLVPSGPAMERA